MSYPPALAWRGSFIQLNATFTLSGSGTPVVLSVPGFWDGGRDWKVRMALPEAGVWHWRTTCSNASDTGLHDKSGAVSVTDYRWVSRFESLKLIHYWIGQLLIG
eukprot:COSAG05_NODE_523_length_9001_cov_3.492474_9_plen_104_part_00